MGSEMCIRDSYESVTRGDVPLRVEGRIRKLTRTVAFLEAELMDEDGQVLASASSVAKVGRDTA